MRYCGTQAIILTTRPILLHVFNRHIKNRQQSGAEGSPTMGTTTPPATPKPHSAMTTALTEACIYAARGTASLLGQLWAEGNVATYGFFDAHYAFSATVILICSNLLRPSDADRDAIVLTCALLQSMVDDGNLPARELHGRLTALQRDIDAMTVADSPDPLSLLRDYVSGPETISAGSASHLPHDTAATRQIKVEVAGARPKLSNTLPSQTQIPTPTDTAPPSTAPLDVPFIQDFLGNFDGTGWSPDFLDLSADEDVSWSVPWDAAEST